MIFSLRGYVATVGGASREASVALSSRLARADAFPRIVRLVPTMAIGCARRPHPYRRVPLPRKGERGEDRARHFFCRPARALTRPRQSDRSLPFRSVEPSNGYQACPPERTQHEFGYVSGRYEIGVTSSPESLFFFLLQNPDLKLHWTHALRRTRKTVSL